MVDYVNPHVNMVKAGLFFFVQNISHICMYISIEIEKKVWMLIVVKLYCLLVWLSLGAMHCESCQVQTRIVAILPGVLLMVGFVVRRARARAVK